MASRIIQEMPFVELHGNNLDYIHEAKITSFTYEDGEIAIRNPDQLLPRQQFLTAMLISQGLSKVAVADLVNVSLNTVQANTEHAFRKLRKSPVIEQSDIRVNRASLPNILLGLGHYTIVRTGKPIPLSPTELSIVQLIAIGYTNLDIAAERNRSPLTIKSNLARIGRKFPDSNRSAITLRAILSEEIEGYPGFTEFTAEAAD